MAKIVVLDDQPDICECIQLRLTADGHEVRTTHTGDAAIDLGYLFQPDILIVDWYLENEYDGIEVTEAFKVASKNVQTILITGRSFKEAERLAAPFDIFRVIAKPFSLNDLVSVVNAALDHHEELDLLSRS